MGLFKRGNVWWAYFYIDGVRYQVSTETGNKKQAQRIFKKIREDEIASRYSLEDWDLSITFEELTARFIAEDLATPYHHERLVPLLEFFSEVQAVRITKSLAEKYRRLRVARDDVKDATVNRDLAVLRRILYWSVDEGILPRNPLARLKLKAERKTRTRILSVKEERKILAIAPQHLKRMVIAALDTGMRRGELFHQQVEDIDFERRLLYVTHSKTAGGESREIPLTDRLFELLSRTTRSNGQVFLYKKRSIANNVRRSWLTALKKAKVRHLRFHDLRHTFNTRLMEAGVQQAIRMVLMGHSLGQTVHGRYTHVELPAKREAIRKLEVWRQSQIKKERRKADDSTEEHTQAVEEKDTGGSRDGTAREAAS